MIAATKEHTGKTSVSMALLSGLIARFGVENVGYIKPVGQKWVPVPDDSGEVLQVDKDVKVAREHWGLTCNYRDMSPLVLDKGYTRRYLDGQVDISKQFAAIQQAFDNMLSQKQVVIVEGTGHTGVGSIVGCNNADVAAVLGIGVVLVANGGLGSTYDELELNRQMCMSKGVPVSGVIINKASSDKLAATRKNLSLALRPWGVPLIGAVPSADSLDVPSVNDLETLFGVRALNADALLRGRGGGALRRFTRFELVTAALRSFMDHLNDPAVDCSQTCFVTHASRHDIILGLLSHAAEASADADARPFQGGLMLTGSPPGNIPDNYMLEYIRDSDMPVLSVGLSTTQALARMEGFTPKMNAADTERTAAVVRHYAPHLDVEALLTLMGGGRAATEGGPIMPHIAPTIPLGAALGGLGEGLP
ncbi:AAA domain-containing protein [Tribonema minus]|uniref:AAA domain-containing protein n=1 Tax=Tribonema minus TaxID=303371 RepID=A0A836C8E0_9STRA|nr:AAA domain-containing protein [Tribonema minus]